MSLIKNKNNYDAWGEVPMFNGHVKRPRYRTRVGHIIQRRIDDTHVLILLAQKAGIATLMDKKYLSEQEYYNEKMYVFWKIMKIVKNLKRLCSAAKRMTAVLSAEHFDQLEHTLDFCCFFWRFSYF